MRVTKTKRILLAMAFMTACIPQSFIELGGSSSLTGEVNTTGILDAVQAPNGRNVSEFINSFGLRIDKTCNGVTENYVSPAYGFDNKNITYTLDTNCDYKILLVLGMNAGAQVSPVYAYNKDGVPFSVTAAQLKDHITNKPGQAFALDIVLGFTVEASNVGLSLKTTSGTQPAQPGTIIPPANPTPTPGSTNTTKCEVTLFTGRQNGVFWCGPCEQFAPTWEGASSKYNSTVLMKEVELASGDPKFQTYGISSVPSMRVKNKQGTTTDIEPYSIESYIQQNCQ